MESTLVIKVKYGSTLRRFNARVDENENLDLDMVGLKAKILSLFSFPSDADLTLTYVDEDGDVVTLVDDNDLRDVMRQHLKFLRINVSVNGEKSGRSYARSSGSSTPLRSPRGQQPLPDVSAIVSEALKTVPEPIREAISKLSLDLASKASSSSPTISDLIDSFTKLGQSYLNTGFQPQVGGNVGGVNGASASNGATSMAADTDAAKDESMHDVMPNSNFGHSSSKECKVMDDGGVSEGGVVSAAPVHVPVDLNADLPGESNISGGETKVEGHKISDGKALVEVLKEFEKKLNDQISDQISCQSSGKTKVALEKTSGGKGHVKFLKAMNKKLNDHIKDQVSRQSAAFEASTSTVDNPGYPNPHPLCIPGYTVSTFQPLHPFVNSTPVTQGLNTKVEVQNVSVGKTQAEVQMELQKNANGSIRSVDPGASPTVANTTGMPKPAVVEPFSGLSLAEDWSSGHGASRRPHPFKRSSNYADSMGGIFHKGIRCDGCGVHPITGPRFKSKVKEDYDLCSICFSGMGNVADYIRIDRPVLYGAYRLPRPFKAFYDLHPWDAAPSPIPHPLRGCGGKSGKPKLDSRFVSDVTVMDGTLMAPSTPFTKIWRMRNTGNFDWPRGTQLVWIGGDKFNDTNSVEIEVPAQGVPVDGELDIAIDFTAPVSAGRYISYWRMASSSGHKFGQRVWVLIQVDDSLKDALCDSLKGLNLNLPAESDESKRSEILDMNVPPAVVSDFFGNDNSNTVTEPVQPMVEQHNEEQELNFPINDNLLVGQRVAASAPPEDSGPISYPVVEVEPPEAIPAATAAVVPAPVIASSSAPSLAVGSDTEAVEKSLLKELEEMGFKQVDLNKEILRMNAYNLEQSVDDLCDVAEWDPILGELQEMGFCDKEMNKKLLKKNNGSIKRVVMDLLTGEKA
ncbi:protein NBR1 homolog [Rhodamnia argentea]|uniref:Protein NBR1 homolog n=1 Tax=Rhodamnia argentea TaxID=178133 RepID=A0A8B8Q5E4_9MYRT|nr:protein NBR1 homolog [Rhodamnia argentea]